MIKILTDSEPDTFYVVSRSDLEDKDLPGEITAVYVVKHEETSKPKKYPDIVNLEKTKWYMMISGYKRSEVWDEKNGKGEEILELIRKITKEVSVKQKGLRLNKMYTYPGMKEYDNTSLR